MSRPIEQALNNLIPRHPGTLPPELIELASSLLAQSRNKCSNLKAEEEVARTYLCANVACERLKTALNLPPIEPRPPIPPKVYKKLYAYFDRTLTASSARQRAQRNAANSRTSTPAKPFPQRLTPSKETSFSSFMQNRTTRKGLKFGSNKEKDERVPRWIGPTIRLLCRELETPRAVPHVLAGVETVLCLPSPEGNGGEERMEGKIPALISAVWFFVVVKMRGKGNYGKETFARKKMALDVLARAREDKSIVERVGEAEEAWRWYEALVHEKDVNAWRKEILARKCKEMDWFENIDEGCGVDGVPATDESDVEEEVADIVAGKETRRAGGGTMIQEKFNYLSEARRREFEEWKMGMMARIDELIAEGIMDTTDG